MPSTSQNSALRKAAILIATLDERTADALLDQMGPEQAARVRNAVMELDAIPPHEQEQVLAEFLGRGPKAAKSASDDGGVELSESLVRQVESQAVTYASATGMTPQANAGRRSANRQPFEFLRNVDSAILARQLGREHPQTIAVVLAHLPPEQVAEILACLPTETSIEALGRMARLEELSPDVLHDIERELEARLPHMATAKLQPHGVANIQAVLDALDQSQRDELLATLGRKDARLMRRLGYVPPGEDPFAAAQRRVQAAAVAPNFTRFAWPTDEPNVSDDVTVQHIEALRQVAERGLDLTSLPKPGPTAPAGNSDREQPRFTFEHFALIDDNALGTILDHADAATVELALTGADAKLIRRVLRLLPVQEAARWRQRLERPSPLRLSDIESAREILARLAIRLSAMKLLTLPTRLGFAAAA
jgi:flagellar motor switch protein FliG